MSIPGSVPLEKSPPPPSVLWFVLWRLAWGLCTLLAGAIAVLVAFISFSDVSSDVAQDKAFHAAVRCTAPGAPADRAECLRTVRATVTGKEIQVGRKYSTYKLTLSGPPPAAGEITMGGQYPLLNRLHRGDRVGVTVWRGYVLSVSREGVSQTTEDTPAPAAVGLSMGLAFLAGGLCLVGVGGCALVLAPSAPRRKMPAVLGVLGRFTVAAVLAAIPAGLLGSPLGGPTGVVIVWLVLVAGAGAVTVHVLRRGRGRAGGQRPKQSG